MKKKNIALDWLRCGAMLLIVYDHLIGFRMPEWKPVRMIDKVLMEPLNLIAHGGALGVSIFLIISGYLLALGIDSGKYTKKIIAKKILNLYIPMVLSYVSFFCFQKVISLLLKTDNYFSQFSIRDWLLGGSLVGYFTDRGDVINGTTWYLVALFVAYAVILMFSGELKKSIQRGFVEIELFLGVTMLLGGIINDGVIKRLFSFNWYVYILLFGLIIYYFEKNKLQLKKFVLGMLVNYLLLIAGVYLYAPHYALNDKYIVSVVYGILLLIFCININEKYDLKNNSIVAFLSYNSYYIYLVHMPYGSLIISLLQSYTGFLMAAMIALVLIMVIAIAHQKVSTRVLNRFRI